VVGVVVELIAPLVDDDLVVVPAEGGEVVGVGGTVVGAVVDVVDLESAGGVAPIGGAHPVVAVQDCAS
jgi:hypothetical protein